MVTSTYDTVGGDLPLPLGGGEQRASGITNPEFDVFISGLALNLHINRDSPYRRETAEWRKEQVDQAPEAGEQSLSSWWLRSQMTFHGGAGINYLDTTADPRSQNRIRFDTSRGIDVWTEGEIKRLPDTELLHGVSAKTFVFGAQVGTESYLVYGQGSTVKADRKVAADTITYTVTGMAGTVLSMAIDGSHYYVATTDGKVFKGPIDNSSAGTAIWNISGSDVTLGWVKQRLMAGIGPSVYELAGTGPALPTALYTHPSASWKWTAFADSPDAVLGAGYSGLNSAIFGFTLTESSGGAPVLSAGVPIGELPTGEQVQSLYLYVGTKLAIGTTRGLRVGEFDATYGSFAYGPLSLETEGPVTSICGRGPYLYLGAELEGEASLFRADLGLAVDDGPIYATAPDLRTPAADVSGRVTSLTVDVDGRLVFAVQGYGIVREGDTYVGRDAWLRTARIRFTTVEPKQFKYGRVRSEGAGELVVEAGTSLFPELREVFSTDTSKQTERFSLIGGAAEWIQLTFSLTGEGKLTSYQVLALPAQPRQRMFGIPVQVFDSERNRHGRSIGYAGRAKAILDTLEAIESSGDEVTVQCPVLGIDAVRCTVDRIEFTQTSPPVAGKSYGLGGYANLVFRTST